MTFNDFFTDEVDDEQAQSFNKVELLIKAFQKDTGRKPVRIFVSDDEEDQSWMLWAGRLNGLYINRTAKKKTYLE